MEIESSLFEKKLASEKPNVITINSNKYNKDSTKV